MKHHQNGMGRYHLSEFPDFISIDTTYACNVMCGMCHLASKDFHIPRQKHISVELITRFLPLLKHTRTAFLLGRGEPLMHPDIYEIIKLIKTECPDIHLAFTTNGTLLVEKNVRKLVDSRVDQINISVDGPDMERGHPQFEKVKANMRYIALQRRAQNIEHLEMHISYVIGMDNLAELKPTFDFGIEVGIHGMSIEPLRILEPNPQWDDYVRSNNIYNHLDTVIPIVDEIRLLADHYQVELTTLIPTKLDPGTLRGAAIRNAGKAAKHRQLATPTFVELNSPKCPKPFTMLRVEMDGSTYLCQGPQGTKINAFDVEPIEIWNSLRAQELRYEIDNEEYDETCLDCHILRNKLAYEAEMDHDRLQPASLRLVANGLTNSRGENLVIHQGIVGFVERYEVEHGKLHFTGWAAEIQNGRPCTFIVVFVDGQNAAVSRPLRRRPDVAQAFLRRGIEMCGFEAEIDVSSVGVSLTSDVQFWAVERFGQAAQLSFTGSAIQMESP